MVGWARGGGGGGIEETIHTEEVKSIKGSYSNVSCWDQVPFGQQILLVYIVAHRYVLS